MNQHRGRWLTFSGALVFGAVNTAQAEGARLYTLEGFGEFLDGNPESTAVREDGTIILPATIRERYQDTAASFSAAAARGDEVLVSRVDDGDVVAIDRAGKTTTVYHVEESLVTALLETRRGLFVAVGTPAKIYRVEGKGKATTFYTPDAGYVWDMVEGPNDTLLLVTGEPGKVVRVDAKGNGTVLFTAEQKHLRSAHYDRELGLFVGGGERGVLYRSADLKTFRALYDTGQKEVTAIITRGNYVYPAGVTGADALASAPASDEKGGKKEGAEVTSKLAQVAMDGSAEVIAGSSDEAIFDLALDDQGLILVATGATGRDDPRGRLYTVEPKRRLIAMVYQSPSRRITHLVPLPRGAIAAVAAAGGRIIHIAGGIAATGEFVTQPMDAGINSTYGHVDLLAELPKGTGVSVAARTGQTAKPDASWSAWSKEVRAPSGRVEAPNGRFFQLRLTLTSDGKATPVVQRLRLAYLRQNLPPFVREVTTLKKGLTLAPVPVEVSKSKTVSLNDKSSKPSATDDEEEGKKNPNRARQTEEPGALTVKWSAEDPNGDELRYELALREVGQADWRPLRADLDAPFFTLKAAQLPDGHYQFQVKASDAPSNPVGEELEDTRESRAVLVDNNPPRVDPLQITTAGRRVTVRVVAADAVGPLVKAFWSLDGGPQRPMRPDDGILDGAGESFTLRTGELPPGAHTVTVQVFDEAENEGMGEARFEVRP